MFYINVWLTVREPSDVSSVREALARAAELSRTEPGCARFEVYQSDADPRRFLLMEHWNDRSDWETHRTRQAFTEVYEPRVLSKADREPHISTRVQ